VFGPSACAICRPSNCPCPGRPASNRRSVPAGNQGRSLANGPRGSFSCSAGGAATAKDSGKLGAVPFGTGRAQGLTSAWRGVLEYGSHSATRPLSAGSKGAATVAARPVWTAQKGFRNCPVMVSAKVPCDGPAVSGSHAAGVNCFRQKVACDNGRGRAGKFGPSNGPGAVSVTDRSGTPAVLLPSSPAGHSVGPAIPIGGRPPMCRRPMIRRGPVAGAGSLAGFRNRPRQSRKITAATAARRSKATAPPRRAGQTGFPASASQSSSANAGKAAAESCGRTARSRILQNRPSAIQRAKAAERECEGRDEHQAGPFFAKVRRLGALAVAIVSWHHGATTRDPRDIF